MSLCLPPLPSVSECFGIGVTFSQVTILQVCLQLCKGCCKQRQRLLWQLCQLFFRSYKDVAHAPQDWTTDIPTRIQTFYLHPPCNLSGGRNNKYIEIPCSFSPSFCAKNDETIGATIHTHWEIQCLQYAFFQIQIGNIDIPGFPLIHIWTQFCKRSQNLIWMLTVSLLVNVCVFCPSFEFHSTMLLKTSLLCHLCMPSFY